MYQESRINFRKTLYFKMIMVTLFLGALFFGALFWFYQMSRMRFEEEFAVLSDALTEQICRNVDISLKELGEKTMPLTETNERLGPLLSGPKEGEAYRRLRIRNQLEEILSMAAGVDWVGVMDEEGRVEFAFRGQENRPQDAGKIAGMIRENEESLKDRPGNTVWVAGLNPDRIIQMRCVFDAQSMRFCGYVIAEVENRAIKAVFENLDEAGIGSFTLYDRNGKPVCRSGGQGYGEVLMTEYPISRGRMRLVHQVDMGGKNRRFSDLLYLMSGLGLVVFLAVVVMLWLMFGRTAKNLKILLENLNRVSCGNFEMKPALSAKGDEFDLLAGGIADMAARIKRLMGQAVKDREIREQNRYALLELRYQELQAQVNPHFLFNILQSINGIAQINGDVQVSRLICMLSKFFRGNIDRRYTSCQLREELEYVRNYLELYRNIYQERLRVLWEVDESLLFVGIPTYILQPIVENSLVHGMEPSLRPCTVMITVREEAGKLSIGVWDSGEGMTEEQLLGLFAEKRRKRVGLGNVQDRIQLLYGQEYGLSVRSERGRYTEVKITLPLPKKAEGGDSCIRQ